MTVRVDEQRYDVSASGPGTWLVYSRLPRSPSMRDYDKATAIAQAYEDENHAELAALFAQLPAKP